MRLQAAYEKIYDFRERDFPILNFVPVKEDLSSTDETNLYVVRIAIHTSENKIYFVEEFVKSTKKFYYLNESEPTFLKQSDVYRRIHKRPTLKCFHKHEKCKKPPNHEECQEKIEN